MNNGMKILWLISVGVAFILGYSMQSPIKPVPNNTSHNIEPSELSTSDIQIQDIAQLKKQNKLEIINKAIPSKSDLYSLIDNLENLLNGGKYSFDMVSIAQAYQLIENLTQDELLSLLNSMNGKINKPENDKLLSLLISRMASFDPLQTASYIENNIDSSKAKMVAMMSMLSSWVKEDPTSAYYWYTDPNNSLTSQKSSSTRGLSAIFEELASQDIYDAFTKLTELDSAGTDTRMAAYGISESLENKEDFIQFIERSDELGNKSVKDSFLNNWVKKSPSETVEWSESILNSKQQKRVQSTIFNIWVREEPTNAANWYISTFDENKKELHAARIISMWGMREPNAALEWLEQQNSFDTQKSIASLLQSSSYRNTSFAINNLDLLTSDKTKADISYNIFQTLKRSSETRADEFLSTSPYQEEIAKKQMDIKNIIKKNNQS
jgi:hypothetical protein